MFQSLLEYQFFSVSFVCVFSLPFPLIFFSDIFLQGKRFHEALESILSPQETLKERDENLLKSGYIESVQHILKDVSGVRALESAVQHETLNYIGLLDCVAEYQGKLCVIDWKTSEKPKPFIQSTFDNPLQVVAYMGAMNHDTNYSFQVQCGLIVVAYKDGSPAHPHFMDAELCSQYWAKWLLRLEEYTEKKKNQNIQKPEQGTGRYLGTFSTFSQFGNIYCCLFQCKNEVPLDLSAT